jgi:hypothetical protein
LARVILLLLLVGASFLLYSTKRDARRRVLPPPTATAISPASDSPSRPVPARAGERSPSTGSDDHPSILPPLGIEDRESLRDAMEDWQPVPPSVLDLEVDLAGRKEIAVAAFRGLLGAGRGSGPADARAIGLVGGERVILVEAQREPGGWNGLSVTGEPLRLPVERVSTVQAPAEGEVLALRRERRETARHHALAHGEDGLLTRLLREALFDGDLPAAEELFLHWIRGAGPLLLAEGLEEAEKRRQFAALARDLQRGERTEVGLLSPAVAGSDSASDREPRTLAALGVFLEFRGRLRRLDAAQVRAMITACEGWEGWLEELARRPDLRPPGVGEQELERLRTEVRVFRFDLIKTSGF